MILKLFKDDNNSIKLPSDSASLFLFILARADFNAKYFGPLDIFVYCTFLIFVPFSKSHFFFYDNRPLLWFYTHLDRQVILFAIFLFFSIYLRYDWYFFYLSLHAFLLTYSYFASLHLFLMFLFNVVDFVSFLGIFFCHFFILLRISFVIHFIFSYLAFLVVISFSDIIRASLNVFHFVFPVSATWLAFNSVSTDLYNLGHSVVSQFSLGVKLYSRIFYRLFPPGPFCIHKLFGFYWSQVLVIT